MKSFLHSLIHFLSLFCNCQFQRLCSIQFFCSQAHILAGWRLETRLFTLCCYCQSQSHIATDGQSVSLWPDIYYCLTVMVLFFWGALPDERTVLYFVYAAGPCQRSLSPVRVPWESRPYFTISDLDFAFRRLLRLAGLRWRYSTPPPNGYATAATANFWTLFIITLHRSHRKHSLFIVGRRVYSAVA
jgi:hypothetical protein